MHEAQSVADNGPPRKRWPRWLKITLILFAVPLALTAWLLVERHRAKSALAKYEQHLIAQGEKLTFAGLVPPLPEGENASPEFLRLCKSLPEVATLTFNFPVAMKLIAPGRASVISKQSGWSSGKLTFEWAEAREDLDENAGTLTGLREVLRSPVLRSTLTYRGHSTLLPHLAPSKRVAQWLSASALYNLHISHVKAAIDDIEAIVMILRLSADEPFLISQLVRIAVANIALNACWAVLQADNVSDEQLQRLQNVFRDLDLVTQMPQAFRGERLMSRDAINRLRAGDFTLKDFAPGLGAADDEVPVFADQNLPFNNEVRTVIRALIIFSLWRPVLSYHDERYMLEEVQSIIAAIDQANAQRSTSDYLTQNAIRSRPGTPSSSWATELLIRRIANGPVRAFRCETQREMTIAAIGLKRYHLRHGKFPQTLDELVPDFLLTHPIDWMDGQKLRYRLDGDSFVLWSVGDNGKDDGATPDQTEPYNFLNGPDIVWPQPASAAEVDAYNAIIRSKR
jgi:hypothetical protein